MKYILYLFIIIFSILALLRYSELEKCKKNLYGDNTEVALEDSNLVV